VTAFFAATVGLVQNDIKRVIAYSTCSQLGYMFAACGLGAYSAGIFHLFTHAFFKALLFLGAGSVIHAMHHEQDIRHMGGLRSKLPITWAMMLIGTVALTGLGIPHVIGTAGFYSKDTIIEVAASSHAPGAAFAFYALVVAAFFTSFYSWRLMFLTFHGKSRADHEVLEHAHESPWVMLVPLIVLAAGALVAGLIWHHEFVGEAYAHFWRGALYTGPANHALEGAHHVADWVRWLPFVMMAGGFLLAYLFYIVSPAMPEALASAFRPVYLVLLNKWYFDELYDWLLVRPARWLGRVLWKGGDGAIIDGLGPDGVAARVQDVTGRVVKLQSGYVYHYAFVMLIGVTAIATLLSMPPEIRQALYDNLWHYVGRGG
jgi:NADH-quinone oxidoreductase subunit L